MEAAEFERLFYEIRDESLKIGSETEELGDAKLYEIIDGIISRKEKNRHINLSDRIKLRNALFNNFKKLDVLQELIDDPSITEIMINGPGNIFIEKNRKIEKSGQSFESSEKLEDIIQQIVSRINRRVNTLNPIADARLPDGSRVHVVLPPVALDGPVITIRKFPEPITMEKLVSFGSITREAAAFLKTAVRTAYNIFISGGTSSGKTTFLNALSAYIPESERVITIEDSAELQIMQIPNLVRLETRDAGSDGKGRIDIAQLIKASLRMRPDRIIVGEVRGKEAADMLNAMDTGHDGSLSTGHGNSTADMLTRLETMVLAGMDIPLTAIKQQIAAAIDIMVHLERLPDHTRRVVEISEIEGYADGEIKLNPLFSFNQEKKVLERKGKLLNTRKLKRYGIREEI